MHKFLFTEQQQARLLRLETGATLDPHDHALRAALDLKLREGYGYLYLLED